MVIKPAFKLPGHVSHVLVAHTFGSMVSDPVSKIKVIKEHGILGDNHAGPRLIDSREEILIGFGFNKGEDIANLREFSAVSAEEMMAIADSFKFPNAIPPGLLGENLIISGIPNFTYLPRGTILLFTSSKGIRRSAALLVCGANGPCEGPGKELARHFNRPEVAKEFAQRGHAFGRRGIVGLILHSGEIVEGDTVFAYIPEQWTYESSAA